MKKRIEGSASALPHPQLLLYLFALEAFILMEHKYGGIRFSNSALNGAFFPLFLLVPCLIVLILLWGPKASNKIAGIVVALVYSVVCWLVMPNIFFGEELMRTSGDSPYHVNHSIKMSHSTVVVYTDSPGAFASYLVHVDEERTLLPGVKWIRHLATAQGEDATIAQVDAHHIRCEFNNDVASQPDKLFYVE